jgi:hypothetical protein
VDIDAVFKQKIYAMAAHESQYFEWLPWTSGTLDQIPEDEEGRLTFLSKRRTFAPNEAIRECLGKWYGDRAASIKHAEAFEICEYGNRPDREEILRLFPMLRQSD